MISGKQVQSLLRIYGKNLKTDSLKAKPEVKAPGAKADAVTISEEGKFKQKAIQVAKKFPDVRQDKVEYFRQAVASGTYEVKEEEVAEQMIYSALLDRLV